MGPKKACSQNASISQHSSSLFSASNASSTVSVNTLARQRTFVPSMEKLFPLVDQLDISLDWKITALGLVVETIQLIAMSLNINITWGPVFGTHIAKVVYFFVFPLFDPGWASGTSVAASAFFWAFLAIIVSVLAIILFYLRQEFQEVPMVIKWYAKLILHMLVSFGLLPVAMTFMSFIVCDRSSGNSYWYSSQQCYSGYGLVTFIFGIVGLLILSVALLITCCFLFDDMPDSLNLAARPTGMITTSMAATKLAGAILFHVLLSKQLPQVFTATFCALCGVQALLYVLFLPYYNMRMNQFRAGQMLCAAAFAGVAAVNAPADSTWHSKSISTIVVLILAVVLLVAGWFVALVRLNSTYTSSIRALQNGTRLQTTQDMVPTYPQYLPVQDMVFTRYPTIERVIIGDAASAAVGVGAGRGLQPDVASEHSDGGGGGGAGESPRLAEEEASLDEWTILDSYISSVLFCSDVELATRFLREFPIHTGAMAPTPRMCAFAARIYTKGMVKYKNDPWLVYQFSVFLSLYAHKLRMGLSEITILQRGDQHLSITLRYRLYRLGEKLKRALRVSNSHQIQLMSVLTELHKEILGAMSSFWSHLTSGSHSSGQLASVADYITEKRENCKALYEKTLRMPNEAILLNYAKFLRDVMLDEETAAILTERVAEEAEMYRQQRLGQHTREGGSHRSGGGSLSNMSRTEMNWQACTQALEAAKSRKTQGAGHTQFSQGSNEIGKMRTTVFIVFAVIIVIVIGMLAGMGVRMKLLNTTTKRIDAAMTCRIRVAIGEYMVGELNYFATSGLSPAQTGPITDAIKSLLISSSVILKAEHTKLTIGSLYTNSPVVTNYMNTQRMEIVEPGILSLEGNLSRSLVNAFDLGFRIASVMQEIGENYGSAEADSSMQFILANAREGTFGRAFNSTMEAYNTQRNNLINDTMWITIVLFCVATFLLLMVYAIILVYLRNIEVTKVATINLFSLIPRSYLRDLYNQSRDKIRNFDKEVDVFTTVSSSQQQQQKPQGSNNAKHEGKKTTFVLPNVSNQHPAAIADKGAQKLTSHDQAMHVSAEPQTAEHDVRDMLLKGSAKIRVRRTSAASIPDFSDEDCFDTPQDVRTYAADEDDAIYRQYSVGHIMHMFSEFFARTAFLLLFIGLAVLLAIAVFGTTYSLYGVVTRIWVTSEKVMHLQSITTDYYVAFSVLTSHAQQYVLTGDLVHVERYYNNLMDKHYDADIDFGITQEGPENVAEILNVRVMMNSAMQRQQMAMWLGSLYYQVPAEKLYLFSRIGAIKRPYDFTAISSIVEETFAAYKPMKPTLTATTDTADAARPPADQIEIARNLVLDDYYNDHRYVLVNDLIKLNTDHAVEAKKDYKTQRTLAVVSLVLLSVCAGAIVLALRAVYVRDNVSIVTRIGLAVMLCVAIAGIVVLAISMNFFKHVEKINNDFQTYTDAFNVTVTSLLANYNYALRVQRYGYPAALQNWASTTNTSMLANSVVSLLKVYIRDLTKTNAINSAGQVATLLSRLEDILYYSDISVLLSANAWGLLGTSTLSGFTYSRSLEPGYMLEYFQFGDSNPYYYTTSEADLQKPPADQLKIAETAVSGKRYDYLVTGSFNDIVQELEMVRETLVTNTNRDTSKAKLFSMVVMCLCAALMGLGILVCMFAVFSIMMERSRSFGSQAATAAKSATVAASKHPKADANEMSQYQRTINGILFISMMLIAALLVVLMVLSIVYDNYERRNSELLGSIASNDWNLVLTLVSAQNIWSNSDVTVDPSRHVLDFQHIITNALLQRQNLFLGSPNGGGGLLGENKAQDLALFGNNVYGWNQYKLLCDVPVPSLGYAVMDFPPDNSGDVATMVTNLFSNGVENVVWQMMGICITMITARSVQEMQKYQIPMLSVSQYISERMFESTTGYYNSRNAAGNLKAIIFLVISGVLLVVIVAVMLLVLRPLLRHLVDEEEGTRLLLRMIPLKVRNEVPAIHQFFTTGTVNLDAELISEACEQPDMMAILVVARDDTVLRASSEALKRFQISEAELIGKKLDVLFPKDRAQMLSTYRMRFGCSHLANLAGKKIRLFTQKGDGVIVPMEMYVRKVYLADIGSGNGKVSVSCFVLRFFNVSVKADIETVRRLQANVFDLSRQPQIVTDQRGVIRLANRATQNLFRYKKEELVGSNVKLLMPFDTARMHDQYLSNFVSRVGKEYKEGNFGSSPTANMKLNRRIVGTCKDGRLIPLELIIGMIFTPEGNIRYLVGHLIDLTAELTTAQTSAATKTLIDMSPIPVIVFDRFGRVTVFSPAAEQCWGYAAVEIVGQPVAKLFVNDGAVTYNFVHESKSDLKHFIDVTRTIEGMRCEGEHFQVEVSMREFRQNNEVMIIGYFKDLTTEVGTVRRNTLNHAAFQFSPVPIVVADEFGIVQSINYAAERQFGYTPIQIVGKNVSMIMPDHIASRHDGYLSHYRETGLRSMLLGPRQEYAKRADGRIFSVEIRLKETTVEDGTTETGFRRLFMAYIRDISSSYQMEMASDMHNSVTKDCPVPMVSINAQGAILSFNTAAEQLLGYEADHVLGHNVSLLMPPRHAQVHDQFLRNYLIHRRKNVVDGIRIVTAQRANGEEVAVELRVREVDKGTVDPIFVATLVDVASMTQRMEEQNLEKAFISMYPASIIVINDSESVRYFSDEATRVFGCVTADDVLGMRFALLLSESEDLDEYDVAMANMLSQADSIGSSSANISVMGEPPQYTFAFYRRDSGRPFAARVFAKRLREEELPSGARHRGGNNANANNNDGEEVLYVLFVHDLSRENVVKQFMAVRQTLFTEFDFIGALQVDDKGIIQYVNPSFLRMLKFDKEADVVGQRLDRIMTAEMAKQYRMYIDRFIATGVATLMGAPREVQLQCSDGVLIAVELTVGHLGVDKQGGDMQFFGFVRDFRDNVRHRNNENLMKELLLTAPLPAMLIGFTPEEKDRAATASGQKHRSSATESTDGQITVFNTAAQVQFQWETAEILGKSIEMLLDNAESGAGATLLSRYRSSLAAITTESGPVYRRVGVDDSTGENDQVSKGGWSNAVALTATGVRRDTTTFPARLTMVEVDDTATGRPALLVYIEEITQHLERHLQLHISATVTDVYPLAIVCSDQDGNVVLFSRQAENMFGIAEEDMLGHNVTELMPPHMAQAHTEEMEKYMRSENRELEDQPRVLLRKIARRMDGTLFPVEVKQYEVAQPKKQQQHTSATGKSNVTPTSLSKRTSYAATSSNWSTAQSRLFVSIIRDTTNDTADAITATLCQASTSAFGLPFFVLNNVGVFEQVNDAFSKMLGYRKEELLGRNVRLLMSPEVVPLYDEYNRRHLQLAMHRKNPTAMPPAQVAAAVAALQKPLYLGVHHKAGHEVQVELLLGNHYAEYLGRASIYGFLRDVRDTVTNLTHFALYETVTSMEMRAIVLVSNTGVITHGNAAAGRMFGYSGSTSDGAPAKIMQGQPLSALLPAAGEFTDFVAQLRQGSLGDGTTGEGLMQGVDGVQLDGTPLTCTVQLREVFESSDEGSYAFIISNGVSVVSDVKEHDLLLRALRSRPLMGVIVAGEDGHITYANEYVSELFGCSSPDELLGQDLAVLMAPHDAKGHSLHIDNYLRGVKGKSTIIGRTRRVVGCRRDGAPVPIDLSVEEQITAEGHVFVSFLEDLREVVQLEGDERLAGALIDSVPVATLLTDGAGTVTQVSASAEWVLQQATTALTGRPLGTLISIRRNSSDGSTTSFKASRHLHPGTLPVEVRMRPGEPVTMTVIELTDGRMDGRVFMCYLQQESSVAGARSR